MKKILTALMFMITCVPLFAQRMIKNPYVKSTDDANTVIKQIEVDNKYTIISFETTATSANSWVQLNKEIYLQTDGTNAHFNYVKSENIPLAPVKEYLINPGDKYEFKVYFEKIPVTAKYLSIIERAGPSSGAAYMNYYGVSLYHSATIANKQVDNVIVDTAVSQPDNSRSKVSYVTVQSHHSANYPMDNTFSTSQPASRALATSGNEFSQVMNAVIPMAGNMARTMMDAQLGYYKQPGKIAELAKLNKEYYDALRKEGFSSDDAIKIITSAGIMPKATDLNK